MSEIQTKVSDLAKQVKEKLGIAEAEVLDDWAKEVALVKELRKDLTPEVQEQKAFIRLRSRWQRELRSPAKFFEGILVRVASPFDLTAPLKAQAKEIFEANPTEAVKKGLTDSQGVALDPHETFKSGRANPNYGKPLPEQSLIQNIVGVCKGEGMDKPMKFRLVLGDRIAGKIDAPSNMPVKFRANVSPTQNQEGWLLLNPYSHMKFEPTDIKGFPDIETIYKEFFADDIIAVEDLEEWHNAHADDATRWCVMYGYVSDADPEPNASTGNGRITFTDESGNIEITTWIPAHLLSYVIGGAGSKAYVNGRSTQSKNRDTQEIRTFINAEGVFYPPKERIALEENPQKVVSRDVK